MIYGIPGDPWSRKPRPSVPVKRPEGSEKRSVMEKLRHFHFRLLFLLLLLLLSFNGLRCLSSWLFNVCSILSVVIDQLHPNTSVCSLWQCDRCMWHVHFVVVGSSVGKSPGTLSRDAYLATGRNSGIACTIIQLYFKTGIMDIDFTTSWLREILT